MLKVNTSAFNIGKDRIIENNKKEEEWVWVEGYKGFENDLKCRDYQYEIGTVHKFEGEVNLCYSGFHFCKNLIDVDKFYSFENFTYKFF